MSLLLLLLALRAFLGRRGSRIALAPIGLRRWLILLLNGPPVRQGATQLRQRGHKVLGTIDCRELHRAQPVAASLALEVPVLLRQEDSTIN